MGVSIREVIEAAGYDLSSLEDARWLISKEVEFDELLDEAEELIENAEMEDDSDD